MANIITNSKVLLLIFALCALLFLANTQATTELYEKCEKKFWYKSQKEFKQSIKSKYLKESRHHEKRHRQYHMCKNNDESYKSYIKSNLEKFSKCRCEAALVEMSDLKKSKSKVFACYQITRLNKATGEFLGELLIYKKKSKDSYKIAMKFSNKVEIKDDDNKWNKYDDAFYRTEKAPQSSNNGEYSNDKYYITGRIPKSESMNKLSVENVSPTEYKLTTNGKESTLEKQKESVTIPFSGFVPSNNFLTNNPNTNPNNEKQTNPGPANPAAENPANPAKNTDPANPAAENPTNPAKNPDPANPAAENPTKNPSGPNDPTNPAANPPGPNDPTNPAANPPGPNDPTNPATNPPGPNDPTNPAANPPGPNNPTNPAANPPGPNNPTNPAANPPGPNNPTNPGPTDPTDPAGSKGPTDPNPATDPTDPTKPTNTAASLQSPSNNSNQTPQENNSDSQSSGGIPPGAIGSIVFGVIIAIGGIFVGYNTYERLRWRKQYRRRQAAAAQQNASLANVPDYNGYGRAY